MKLGSERKICPFFEFVEGVEIQIGYINDDDAQDMLKQATAITFRGHQKENEVDNLKFLRKMAKRAIIGWKPFKRLKLLYLLAPDKQIILDSGESMDDKIPFSEEMADFIIENTHIDFFNFVIKAAREAEIFARAAEKQELENLSKPSGEK